MTDDDEGAGWYSDAAATFGDRMAGAREALGLTQSELARRIGVQLKTLRAWEEDLGEPRANRLQMLAGVLNVSMMWLMTGRGQGLDAPSGDAVISPDISGILTDIRQVRSEMDKLAERLALLEKRLRHKLKDEA